MNTMKLVKNKLNTDNRFTVPPMLLRTLEAGGFLRANDSFLAQVGFSAAELAEKPFLHWIAPNDIETLTATIEGRQGSCRVAHRTHSGEHFPLEIRVVNEGGESMVLARSVEDAKANDGPEDSRDEATVSGTLHTIAQIVEEQNPGYKCSILLVADGRFVRGAGPSLPEEYNAAIDGFAIGPTVGSCGTAIYWNVPVIVEDIQADPLWVPFAALAKKAGVAACWSYPFSSRSGNVLGALAFYSPVPRLPTKEQLGRLKAAARMTGLAVERGRAEEALRIKHKRELELEEQLQQAQKMEAIGTLAGGIAHDFNNILGAILGYAEMAREMAQEGSLQQTDLDKVIIAGNRGKDLVSQILAFSRQSKSEQKILLPNPIVKEAIKLLRSSIPSTITIKQVIDDRCGSIKADPTQFHQVIMNLCTNAYHAMEKDGGNLTISLEKIQ